MEKLDSIHEVTGRQRKKLEVKEYYDSYARYNRNIMQLSNNIWFSFIFRLPSSKIISIIGIKAYIYNAFTQKIINAHFH